MVQKLYVPYTEESASDWSPNCVVMYEDYAKLEADFKAYKASAYTVAEQYVGVIKELEAELQKYKDQFPDYVECANCGSVTHVGGAFVTYEDYAELESAVNALLIDISRRYPGEEFKCPLIAKLAEITKYDISN